VERIGREGHPSPRYAHCDIRDVPALQAAIAEAAGALGPVAVLVNNAAHDERHRLEDVTPQYWEDRLAVNLRHQFSRSRRSFP
jgi:NAD(P)-dependent dehydrogenase (short-subunit alcohol dehydrogenase family)